MVRVHHKMLGGSSGLPSFVGSRVRSRSWSGWRFLSLSRVCLPWLI